MLAIEISGCTRRWEIDVWLRGLRKLMKLGLYLYCADPSLAASERTYVAGVYMCVLTCWLNMANGMILYRGGEWRIIGDYRAGCAGGMGHDSVNPVVCKLLF